MAPQDPKVSPSAPSLSIPLRRGDLVLACRIGAVDYAIARFVDYDFGLCERKSGELDVKIKINKTLQLDCECLAVPAGVLRQFVVGDHVGASLDLRKVREAQHRDLRETKQLRRGNTTMARNNLAVVGRQHRIHEAEALDRRSNLLDLCLAVASRIARIGF